MITDDNQDISSARSLKMRRKKSGKENVPSVTWIAMQPTVSTKTRMKSVADYLSEVQEDIPMPKRRLCISPETLNALQNAEKLVEHAEKQISEMNFNDLLTDDLEINRFDNKTLEEESMHIRKVVASTLQKGFYDPAVVSNRDNLRSTFTLTDATKYNPSREMYKTPRSCRTTKESPKMTLRAASCIPKQPTCNPLMEDCLFCKYSQPDQSKATPQESTTVEPREAEKKSDIPEKKIEEDKPEKLNVQKGPSISIKADFSVQTSQIVDIRPKELRHRTCNDNFVTYEFNHESCHEKTQTEMNELLKRYEEPRRDENAMDDGKVSATNLQLSGFRDSRQCDHRPDNTSGPSRRNESPAIEENSTNGNRLVESEERKAEKDADSWRANEEVSIDLDDFSLREPRILNEMDALLEQQRKIIRQVHSATEQLDRFLLTSLPDENPPTLKRNKLEKKHRGDRKRSTKRNNAVSDKENEKLVSDYRAMGDATEINSIFKKIQAANGVASASRVSDKAQEITSGIDQLPLDTYPTRLVETTSRGVNVNLDKEPVRKAAQDVRSTSTTMHKISSAETSQEPEYSDTFEDVTSVNEAINESSASDSRRLLAEVVNKKFDKESSSNNNSLLQVSSAHTETKSNAGFIENLKSPQLTKENNLGTNTLRKTEKSVNEILKSLENIRIDEDSKTKKKAVNNVDVEDRTDEKSLMETNKDYSGKRHNRGVEKDNVKAKLIERKKSESQNSTCLAKQEPERTEVESHSAKEDMRSRHKEQEKVDKSEEKINGSSEKLQNHAEENSQKTSHLIESISDISFHPSADNTKTSQDSLRLSALSHDDKREDVTGMKDTLVDESNEEKSTESKIESKLSEVRENLNSLMKSMNNSVEDRNYSNAMKSGENSVESRKNSNRDLAVPGVPIKLTNNEINKNISSQGKSNSEEVILNKKIPNNREQIMFNNRSYVTMLEENSNVVSESFQQHKFSLLKKLESCSMQSHYQGKRLFTSTVLTDAEPPNSFARLKESSESSSETHSEGEICLSHSTSYSLGEIRKNLELSKPNSYMQSSSSTATNSKTSLTHSMGEICRTDANSSLS